MPGLQVAAVDEYDFGAPSTLTEVLRFKNNPHSGGLVKTTFLCPSLSGGTAAFAVTNGPLTFSLQVSADGSSWNALTVNSNLVVVTNVTLVALGMLDYTFLMRNGIDNYLRLLASGNGRGQMQIRRMQSVGQQLILM